MCECNKKTQNNGTYTDISNIDQFFSIISKLGVLSYHLLDRK